MSQCDAAECECVSVAVYGSVLQCVAVCCSVLYRAAGHLQILSSQILCVKGKESEDGHGQNCNLKLKNRTKIKTKMKMKKQCSLTACDEWGRVRPTFFLDFFLLWICMCGNI